MIESRDRPDDITGALVLDAKTGVQVTVTVLVMTYNHESYIRQALDSALSQKTTFPFEVLISEDCSTDRTRDMIVEYAQRAPDRIRLLLSERNIRSNEVVARGFRAARGTYIALLDGDDYWTDTAKLEKQVDFLERHPACTICFHNAAVVDSDGRSNGQLWNRPDQKEISTLDDLWQGNFIATASTMFRRGIVEIVPDWYRPFFPITDWPLHVLHAEHGSIGYLDEVMSAYRHHSAGLYTPLSDRAKLEKTDGFYRAINANLGYRYNDKIKAAHSRYFFDWAREYAKRGDLATSGVCLMKTARAGGLGKSVSYREWIRAGGHLAAARLARIKTGPGRS